MRDESRPLRKAERALIAEVARLPRPAPWARSGAGPPTLGRLPGSGPWSFEVLWADGAFRCTTLSLVEAPGGGALDDP